MKKSFSLYALALLLGFCILLVSCGGNCEHSYDNACDQSCNECGAIREIGAHEYTSGDCTSAIVCTACGYTVRGAKEHTPEKDDGNCATAIKCVDCGKELVAGTTEHNDTDNDCTCNNTGEKVTLDEAPKDESSGIDLPLVPVK